MVDVVFRTAATPKVAQQESVSGKEVDNKKIQGHDSEIDPPYTDFERVKGHPYTVDYFELGDLWDRPEGSFKKEVSLIEEYLTNKINTGKMGNNREAVKKELKRIEKLVDVDKTDRKITRIETIAAYVEFLMRADKIRFNISRYGSPE